MKYTEVSHWTIKEPPKEVRGRGAQDLNPGTYADEEFAQQEATERMLQNDAADVTQAGTSAASALGRKIRREIQADQEKSAANEERGETIRPGAGQGAKQNVDRSSPKAATETVSTLVATSKVLFRSGPEAAMFHERRPHQDGKRDQQRAH